MLLLVIFFHRTQQCAVLLSLSKNWNIKKQSAKSHELQKQDHTENQLQQKIFGTIESMHNVQENTVFDWKNF